MINTDDIRWESFERSALPKALFGMSTGGVRGWRVENALESGQGIALGYSREEKARAYAPPELIILEDKTAAETLSWLKTYAPETSPLSQFARVVTRSDWEQFGRERSWRAGDAAREDRWACVVVGELLAQGESDVEVSALPLSWSSSCFSTAVARSAIIHSHDEAIRACVERLLLLERDQKFTRRPVSVASLEPLWAVAASRGSETLDAPEVVDLALSGITRAADGPASLKTRMASMVGTQSEFSSDSVENRVVAFQKLTSQVTEDTGNTNPTALAQAVIAAGAFLVGRGSSHGFLLGRLPRRWSQAFAWFGLMNGLSGPQSWDGEWSRAAKGVERSLRGRFDWCGVSGADLSWPEYLWLTTTFAGKQAFAEIPKMVPKVLSVEIAPGATCQLRLAADAGGSPREVGRGEHVEAERRNRELRDTLEHLADLAIRARHLLSAQDAQRSHGQGSLGFDDSEEHESNASRSRRSKRPQS
jgi:hypothetical protein